MPIRKIVKYPDPILTRKSKPVTVFDSQLEQLIIDMADTMFAAPGSGLAAVQIGVLKQVIVMNMTQEENGNRYLELINPSIIQEEGSQVDDEGCLSVPDYHTKVKRARKVRVHAQDVHGTHNEYEFEDWPARVIQHEVDHINGKLFLSRISALKRSLYQKRLKKHLKEEGAAGSNPLRHATDAE